MNHCYSQQQAEARAKNEDKNGTTKLRAELLQELSGLGEEDREMEMMKNKELKTAKQSRVSDEDTRSQVQETAKQSKLHKVKPSLRLDAVEQSQAHDEEQRQSIAK